MKTEEEVNIPIFSLYALDDKLLVSGGGGNIKFGVKNKILLYQLKEGYFGKKLYEENLDKIPEFIEGIQSKKIFSFCCENNIFFYSILQDNKFQKIYTLIIKPENISLNCFKINENILATGDENGSLKLFKIEFNNNEINTINEIASNTNAHWRGINKIFFGKKNNINFLITASGDGTCKIFDITNPSLIKNVSFFSFRKTHSEPANYLMRDLIYINEKNLAYTIQSLQKGKSFLTKWNTSNINFVEPIETIEISRVPCTSFDITENKKYLGITDSQGKIFFVDAKNMEICWWGKIGEEMLKKSLFYKEYLITGSIDSKVRISKLTTGLKGTFLFFKYIFYIAIFFGICYYIYLKKNNLIHEDD